MTRKVCTFVSLIFARSNRVRDDRMQSLHSTMDASCPSVVICALSTFYTAVDELFAAEQLPFSNILFHTWASFWGCLHEHAHED